MQSACFFLRFASHQFHVGVGWACLAGTAYCSDPLCRVVSLSMPVGCVEDAALQGRLQVSSLEAPGFPSFCLPVVFFCGILIDLYWRLPAADFDAAGLCCGSVCCVGVLAVWMYELSVHGAHSSLAHTAVAWPACAVLPQLPLSRAVAVTLPHPAVPKLAAGTCCAVPTTGGCRQPVSLCQPCPLPHSGPPL